jgi:hypothetical protein
VRDIEVAPLVLKNRRVGHVSLPHLQKACLPFGHGLGGASRICSSLHSITITAIPGSPRHCTGELAQACPEIDHVFP